MNMVVPKLVFKLQDLHALFKDDAISFIDETTESMFDYQLQDTTTQQGDENVFKSQTKTLTLRFMLM